MTTDITITASTVTAMHPSVSTLKTSNYTVLITDYVIGIGTLAGSITITLPASPASGDQYIVKDVNGSAGTYPVTVAGNGANIDGSSTFKLSQNYAAYTFLYTGSQWSIMLAYAGQQNGNGFGTYANRPVQGQAGRTYYGTDTSVMYYDDGTAWRPIGQTDVCTPLASADFTWQNQNGAGSTDFGSSIYLSAPNNGGTSDVRFFYKTAPGTPYTITAKIVHLGGFVNGAATKANMYGVAWGDGTKLTTFHVNTGDTTFDLNIANWDNVTTFNANVYANNDAAIASQLEWFRFADDGTNRSCAVSRDGINFVTIYSVARTNFLTPTRVGLILNPYEGEQHTSVVSWKQS